MRPRHGLRSLLLAAAGLAAATSTAGGKPSPADLETEKFLLEAAVVESEELGVGVTRPLKVKLEKDGRTAPAVFKDVDVQNPGVTRLPGGKTEINFSDKYAYERAAYLLDRHLGMGMIPVAVIRKWKNRQGAMIEWVGDATPENERAKRGLEPPDPVIFNQQRSVMAVFDALIYNVDRNQSNQLITTADWKLHLIDHSRSFRMVKKLPEVFAAKPANLPRALYEALRSLDEDALAALLEDLVTRPQIKALLERRDLIVRKVDQDIGSYGEKMVLQE